MSEIPPLVHVIQVEVIGDHELRLTFEDGTVGDVSFRDREWRGVFEPLRDPARFDDGLDMAPEPLYAEARQRQVTAHG